MKKIICFAFALIMSASLIGCGKDRTEEYKADVTKIINEYYGSVLNKSENNDLDANLKKELEPYTKKFKDQKINDELIDILKNIDEFTNKKKDLEKYNGRTDLTEEEIDDSYKGTQKCNEFLNKRNEAIINLKEKYKFDIKDSYIDSMKKAISERNGVTIKPNELYDNSTYGFKVKFIKAIKKPNFHETYVSSETDGKNIMQLIFEMDNYSDDDLNLFRYYNNIKYNISGKDNDGYKLEFFDTENLSEPMKNNLSKGEKKIYKLTVATNANYPKEITVTLLPYETPIICTLPVE